MNPSPVDVETLAPRVEKLEAANRRWKSSSVIALLFLTFSPRLIGGGFIRH